MITIFMNYKNSKTSDPHRLLLNLTIDVRRKDKYIALSNLSIIYTLLRFAMYSYICQDCLIHGKILKKAI